jgi:hypothetical protein
MLQGEKTAMASAMVTILHSDIQHDHVTEWWGMQDGKGPHRACPSSCEDGRGQGLGGGFNLHGRHDDIPDGDASNLEATAGPQPEASAPPDTSTLLNTANWTYYRDLANLPTGLRFLEVDGQPLAQEVTADGFYGAAFLTAANQVIVAFEGTHISALEDDPEFVAAQVLADGIIFAGLAPPAYGDGLRFTEAALAAAAAQGIPETAFYITGHSLGGAVAAFVAAQLNLPGETFGAPGILAAAIPTGMASKLTNYVEYGDTVGNYSAEPDVLNGFVQSPDILRFGPPSYIGDPLAALALEAAGQLFGPGTTEEENEEGLVALGALATQYHVLTTYALDLGVTLQNQSETLSGFAFAFA